MLYMNMQRFRGEVTKPFSNAIEVYFDGIEIHQLHKLLTMSNCPQPTLRIFILKGAL